MKFVLFYGYYDIIPSLDSIHNILFRSKVELKPDNLSRAPFSFSLIFLS